MPTLADQLASLLGEVAGVTERVVKAVRDEPRSRTTTSEVGRNTQGGVDGPVEPTDENPQALFWDPFSIIEQLGYKDKPSSITYGTLDAMVWKVPLIQGILVTRINQLTAFTKPQPDIFQTGFRITPADKTAKPTNADRKFISKMEDMILTTGVSRNPLGRDSFRNFIRKCVRDSMKYDQMCFEIVKNRQGLPAQFFAVDASTIRLADSTKTYYDEDEPDAIRTVQVYDNVVVNEWRNDEMAWCIRNPSTSIRNYGYGISELEMLVNAITAILWAWEYNQRFFSQGSVAKGLLNFKGPINQKQLRAFRRQWYQMISGVENAWRSPVMNAEDVQWLDMAKSNRDMEFSAWFDFLIKSICAIYAMDPQEVNFKYGNTGQQRSLFEAGNKQKLMESKDKGLKPILMFLQECITNYIVRPIDPDFCFEFVGLEAHTQEEKAKLDGQRVKTTHTVNELRAEYDLEPLEHGDIILDPIYSQQVQAQQSMDMGLGPNGEQFGEEGDEDQDDEFGENDFNNLLGGGGSKPAKPAGPAKAEKSLRKAAEEDMQLDILELIL